MKLKSIKTGATLIILFYPILYLFKIKKELLAGNWNAYLMLAIILGLWGYLYPPVGDMYSYAKNYELYENLSFSQFVLVALLYNKDFFLPLLDWIFSQFGIPNDWSRFVFVFLGSLISFRIFYCIQKQTKMKNSMQVVILFFVYVLLLNINFLLFRFGLSMAFFVFGYYKLIYENSRIGYLYVVLAIFCHFGISPLLIPLILSQLIRYKGSRKVSLVLMIILLFADIDVADQLLKQLPLGAGIMSDLEVYTSGFWKEDYLQEVSMNYKILQILNKIGYYSLFVFYIRNYSKSRNAGFIDMLLVVMVILSPMKAMFDRFIIVFNFILAINFVWIMLNNNWHVGKFIKLKRTFLFIGIFLTLLSVWAKRRELLLSDEYLLFTPSIFIVSHTYNNTWIDKHVDQYGDFESNTK